MHDNSNWYWLACLMHFTRSLTHRERLRNIRNQLRIIRTKNIWISSWSPSRVGGFLSDVVLVGCQAVHERANQIVCGEVEHQAEGYGDGKSRQSLLENGQQEERQTQSLQNNHSNILKLSDGSRFTQIKLLGSVPKPIELSALLTRSSALQRHHLLIWNIQHRQQLQMFDRNTTIHNNIHKIHSTHK